MENNIIDESSIIEEINGEMYYDEERALAWLLNNDYLFLNMVDMTLQYLDFYKDDVIRWTTCVYVNCNDIFGPGADEENLEFNDGEEGSEIIKLYKLCKENYDYGSIKFCALKRKMQPMKYWVEKMKEVNFWDDELESLKENPFL